MALLWIDRIYLSNRIPIDRLTLHRLMLTRSVGSRFVFVFPLRTHDGQQPDDGIQNL